MSSTLNGPIHILRWTSKFTRKLAMGSSGGEVYATSEMLDRMFPLPAYYEPFLDLSPGIIG